MPEKEKTIHIITLNIPYPPDYGGMIDSYYRIKALHSIGIKIHLHCYAYDRQPSKELESLCESVHYYTRQKGLLAHLTWKPYIVSSRNSVLLLQHLLKDNAPILFDGLHTTFHIARPELKNRIKAVRLHNIEHHYYRSLCMLEPNIFKKIFFFLEAIKLQYYERILFLADHCFAISPGEQLYFQRKYKNTGYLPSFHPFNKVECLPGKGAYVLFHGDLSVIENVKSCEWLIGKVFSLAKYPCIIAGKNPSEHLKKLAEGYANITVVANPTNGQMNKYIRDAHINVLIALKNNGLKLKLLISLYAGRFCLVNPTIIENTIFDKVCHVAQTPAEFLNLIDYLMKEPFTQDMAEVRKTWLNAHYDNRINAIKLMDVLVQ